jgi:hypothetical protein
MKKHWQIRPRNVLVIILILGITIFFALKTQNYAGLPQSESRTDMGYSTGMVSLAPAMDAELGYTEKSFVGNTVVQSERMIIKTGTVSIVVDDVKKSIEDIIKYTEEKGGFLVTSDVSKYDIEVSGNLTVRVPSKMLDETMAYVKAMGEVQNEHVDGRDITEEYTDLEAKLGNLKATERQFLEIMKNAVKIEDVLAVQRELSYVRGEIESLEGRMKYLKESVDLSSLTVYLSTNPENLPVVNEEDQWKPLAIFKEALRSLMDTGKSILNGLIWFGVYLPIIIVVLFVAWFIKKRLRNKKKKK